MLAFFVFYSTAAEWPTAAEGTALGTSITQHRFFNNRHEENLKSLASHSVLSKASSSEWKRSFAQNCANVCSGRNWAICNSLVGEFPETRVQKTVRRVKNPHRKRTKKKHLKHIVATFLCTQRKTQILHLLKVELCMLRIYSKLTLTSKVIEELIYIILV